MVNVKKEGLLLTKTDLDFEHGGVLNPAVYQDGDILHLYYRAIGTDGHSTMGYCRLEGPLNIVERHTEPVFLPELDYESHGVEDPRIVKIDELYYLTFTAYDGTNAVGALATSTDLKAFDRKGIITPDMTYETFNELTKANPHVSEKSRKPIQPAPGSIDKKKRLVWDKDVVFFPRRINEQLYFLHRILPSMQIVSVTTLAELNTEFWEEYVLHLEKHTILLAKYEFENSHMGAGCPPIETEEGWLLIYHGVQTTDKGYVYTACAALMDLENPLIELSRLPYALFEPDNKWETKGIVNNVVFPTGLALFDDTLYIYYGAADKRIACASLSLKELIAELIHYKEPKDKNAVLSKTTNK